MGRPESDWKNQPNRTLDALLLVVGAVLLAASLALWWAESLTGFLGIAVVVAGAGTLYFTSAWQPILYVLAAAALVAFGVFLLVGGAWRHPPALLTIGLAAVAVALAAYLGYVEEFSESERART